jgi:subtilisin family serine protease
MSDPAASPDPLESLADGAEAALRECLGRGVRVGLVDSGVDAAWAAGRLRAEAVFRPSPDGRGVVDVGSQPLGRSPHGSAVAQIIARLAPEAELYSADVLDDAGRGGAELVLAGLEWALDRGCRVINVSLGVAAADLPRADRRLRFAELAERAYYEGAVIVAAAHNQNALGVSALPSMLASVIGVDRQGFADADRLSASWRPERSPGPAEAAACGKSLHPQYRFQSATSFAAPRVTAMAARLLEWHPSLKPFEVKAILFRLSHRSAS